MWPIYFRKSRQDFDCCLARSQDRPRTPPCDVRMPQPIRGFFHCRSNTVVLRRQLTKTRHLVVVMDRASPHVSKMTKKFIDVQKRLHVFYLPPRSPEFNPDEQVWSHLKHHDLKSHQQTTLSGLKNLTQKKLTRLSKDQGKLRGIFNLCENAAFYL